MKPENSFLEFFAIHDVFVKIYVCGSHNLRFPLFLMMIRCQLMAGNIIYFQILISVKKGVISRNFMTNRSFLCNKKFLISMHKENLGECLKITPKHTYICVILKTKLCKFLFFFVYLKKDALSLKTLYWHFVRYMFVWNQM